MFSDAFHAMETRPTSQEGSTPTGKRPGLVAMSGMSASENIHGLPFSQRGQSVLLSCAARKGPAGQGQPTGLSGGVIRSLYFLAGISDKTLSNPLRCRAYASV